MNKSNWGRVSLAVLVLGCSGKINVDPHGSGGSGGGHPVLQGGVSGGESPGRGGRTVMDGGGPPVTGGRGGTCIPGQVAVEAKGTVAEAEVETLAHCDDGYACNANNRCEPMPNCKDVAKGDCVVFVSGAGGASSGTGGGFSRDPIVGVRPAITGMATDQHTLYWIGYGSRDKLGNHNHDGSLHAVSLEDGTTTVLASDLAGPIGLGITSSYAYVVVDGGPNIGTEERPEIWRFPRSGGKAETIPSSTRSEGFYWFFGAGSLAFWPGLSGVVRFSDEESTPGFDETGWPLAADETHIYYDGSPGVRRALISDSSQVEELAGPSRALILNGEFMYSLESVAGVKNRATLLTRAPKAGGDWVRTRALGAAHWALGRIKYAGDRYFFESFPPASGYSVDVSLITASIDSDGPAVRALNRTISVNENSNWWVGTEDALFWTDGNAIYRRALE